MTRPLIGITSGITDKKALRVSSVNFQRIIKAGGVPVVLPNIKDEQTIDVYANTLDGLLLTGGHDLDPLLYSEEPIRELEKITPNRDFFEIQLTQAMYKKDKPIFGICRGLQVLNVVQGGTLYQDIYSQNEQQLLKHGQDAPTGYATHFVKIEKNSHIFKIIKQEKIRVNTYHHQAIKDLGDDIKVTSRTSDGIIESIESKHHSFALGVQWHPEYLTDAPADALFVAFVKAACNTN